MFLPSYSFPFSVSVLLMKGLLSLGLPSPEKAEESGAWHQLREVMSAFLRGPSAPQGKPGTQGALLRPEVAFSLHLEDGGGRGVFRVCQQKLSAGHRDRQAGRGGG